MWNASAFNGFVIEATDGTIGTVSDLLFDDVTWISRWLVVTTGGWLNGRSVLLPISALGEPNPQTRQFPVKLTMQQVTNSPDIETDLPVSRQMEAKIYESFGSDPYWGGGLYATSNAMAVPFRAPEPLADGEPIQSAKIPNSSDKPDHHLRSMSAITGYQIYATDGAIGHVEDFLVDEHDWSVRYIVVDTSRFLFGKHVIMATRSKLTIDWAGRMIRFDVDRETIKSAPSHDQGSTVDGQYDSQHIFQYVPM